MMRWSTCVALVVALTLPGAATAATVIVVETESLTSGRKGGTAMVYVDDKCVRIDSNEGGSNFTIIYSGKGETPVYWIIDRRERTYFEIDRKTMMQARRDLEQSIETMRKQLKTVPPAQREQMERTMQQNMERMGFGGALVEYTPVSRGVMVGEWRCNHYQGEREGTKVEEVWAAEAGEMGLRADDLKAMGEMAEMFEGTGQDMPAFFSFARDGGNQASTYEGFPVIVVTYSEGKTREKSQVKEVRRDELEDGFFDLPAGLTRKSVDR